jgi:hypothetical protein
VELLAVTRKSRVNISNRITFSYYPNKLNKKRFLINNKVEISIRKKERMKKQKLNKKTKNKKK